MCDSSGCVCEPGDATTNRRSRSLLSVSASHTHARQISDMISNTSLHQISNTLDDYSLFNELQRQLALTSTKKQHIDASTLARNWGIGLETAARTLHSTTQRGVRTVLHPSLSRRFRTNDRQLRTRRLREDIYTDTLISKTKSQCGNKYAQIFGTVNGWARVFSMQKKLMKLSACSLPEMVYHRASSWMDQEKKPLVI